MPSAHLSSLTLSLLDRPKCLCYFTLTPDAYMYKKVVHVYFVSSKRLNIVCKRLKYSNTVKLLLESQALSLGLKGVCNCRKFKCIL